MKINLNSREGNSPLAVKTPKYQLLTIFKKPETPWVDPLFTEFAEIHQILSLFSECLYFLNVMGLK